MNPSPSEPPAVVLDTNVVLDWVLFRNPDFAALEAAIITRAVRWIATAAMRDELSHVLAHGQLDRWKPDPAAIQAHWERHCIELPEAAPAGPSGRLRCTDPDDQKFIDLAVDAGANWLISRDRAVLRLARRLRGIGVAAIPPGAWTALTRPG